MDVEVFYVEMMMEQLFFTLSSSQVVCLFHLAYKVSMSLVSIRNQSSYLSVFYPVFLSLSLWSFLASSLDLSPCPILFLICLMKSPTLFSKLGSSEAASTHLIPWKDTFLLKNYKIHIGMLKTVTFWLRTLHCVKFKLIKSPDLHFNIYIYIYINIYIYIYI